MSSVWPPAAACTSRLIVALLLVCASGVPAAAQAVDSTRVPTEVAGAVTVTNNGISTIPSFSLGRPAAIIDLSLARRGLSVEPQFKVGLDGKPWSILFWGRYKLVTGERFNLSVGGHPALSFRTVPAGTNASTSDVIAARRYLASEVSPSFALTRNLSVGAYWLYSRALERDVARHTNFLSLRSAITTASRTSPYLVRLAPQLYYLRVGDRDGFYLNSTLSLARRGAPLSVSTVVNRSIRTDVPGSDPFLWNVSLTYAIR